MTLTYSGHVANANLGVFARLLFRWKGSIYKLIYQEMLIFGALYAALSIVYRLLLTDTQKRSFEQFALYCEAFINLIPLSFVLGFYVAVIVGRWWSQFLSIPWPDNVVMYMTVMIDGMDEQGRIIRRTLVRYIMLATLLVFQATSVSVKKRFPTMLHILEAGVVTEAELKALDEVVTSHGKWWVPFAWAVNLVKSARRDGRITDDYLMRAVIGEILSYRSSLGLLYCYDWITIPLVYTQVATLAVYTFFVGCIFGRQFLDPQQGYPGHSIDIYVPIFTLLQFFFYMGWLKVAEHLINPFGEDDDDFEMNWIIDRNMQLSMLVVDELHNTFPKLEKDIFFGEVQPDYLPYTKSSIGTLKEPFMGSTANLSVSDVGMQVVMETIPEVLAVSHLASPLPSPARTRRLLHQNVLSSAAHSQWSLGLSQADVSKPAFCAASCAAPLPPRAVSICFDDVFPSEAVEGERKRAGSVSHRFVTTPHTYVQSPLVAEPVAPTELPGVTPPAAAAAATAAAVLDASGDSSASDVPLIVVDSGSSSSSEEQLSYEPPDPSQVTVTSLTALLTAVDCMPPALPEGDMLPPARGRDAAPLPV